ncbi:MAG: hypothetical protein ACP5O8_01460 [Candidatus Aenigmatarchaeota archaeon]
MKGQAFLIIAVIFITILALIKASISFQEIKEGRSLFFEFENVKGEMVKSVEFSVYEKENITKNVENFAEFARNSFKRRTLNLKLLLVEAMLENNALNVSLKNLLGHEIILLNISLNNSFEEFGNIKDGEKATTSFNLPSENASYSLKIFYKTPYSQEQEEIPVEVETGKSKFIIFFDIVLESESAKLMDKILKNYELP